MVEHRLNLAKSLGADYILKTNPSDIDLDIVKKVHQILGCEPTISIDCSGAEQAVRTAIQVLILTGSFVCYCRKYPQGLT